MSETRNIVALRQLDDIDDPLTNILRAGAGLLLVQAVEIEVETFLATVKDLKLAPETAIDVFAEKYRAKYSRAVECLGKDRDALLAFYDFPAEHWDHLRTTNRIERVFATLRHRTVRTKGSLSSTTARLMVFKLVVAASKTWRRLKGTNQLPKVIAGVRFNDGIKVIHMPANRAA
jgi:putative transposase